MLEPELASSNLATLHEILQLGVFALFQFLAKQKTETQMKCFHESGDATKYKLAEFVFLEHRWEVTDNIFYIHVSVP